MIEVEDLTQHPVAHIQWNHTMVPKHLSGKQTNHVILLGADSHISSEQTQLALHGCGGCLISDRAT